MVPYFCGTLAVGVRTDRVKETPKGFEALFDERYRGHITLLDDAEDVVAATLLHLGLPMNSTEDADLAKVEEVLLKQRPLVQSFTSDDYKERLIQGNTWVALGWSGDLLQAKKLEKRIAVVVPENGTMIWVDSMAVCKTAKNPRLAHEFINFLLEPDIGARNANFLHYATPNATARSKIDAEIAKDPAVYPPQTLLDKCQWLKDRGTAIAKIEKVWKQLPIKTVQGRLETNACRY